MRAKKNFLEILPRIGANARFALSVRDPAPESEVRKLSISQSWREPALAFPIPSFLVL